MPLPLARARLMSKCLFEVSMLPAVQPVHDDGIIILARRNGAPTAWPIISGETDFGVSASAYSIIVAGIISADRRAPAMSS